MKYIPNNPRCMKGRLATDIPTVGKKHFLPQSSDTPKHIGRAVEGGDFSDSFSGKNEPFLLKERRSENISDPNEGCGQ
jgi:hypothetical protein